MQITDTVLMIRPAAFSYNAETATNNFFQQQPTHAAEVLQQKALEEFDAMVNTLKAHDINVIVIKDTEQPAKPDAVFPNNWFSTNREGVLSVFPMHAAVRRLE